MKKTINALEFGTSKIVALVAENGSDQRCDVIGAGSATYDGYLAGQWNSPGQVNDAIAKAIEEAEMQSKQKITEISIGVPGDFCQVRTVEVKVSLQGTDPKVTARDVDELFRNATAALGDVRGHIIHRAPAWFIVDDGKKTLEPMGMRGSELHCMVSFILADPFFIDDVTYRLNSMRITVGGVFSTSIGEASLFIPDEERQRTTVFIDCGYLSTEIMTVEGDALTSLKVIPIGGGNISFELAEGLNIHLNTAEQVKRQYVYGLTGGKTTLQVTDTDGSTREIARADAEKYILPCAKELCEEIEKAISESGVHLSQWSCYFLTGGGMSLNRGGRDYLSAKLGRPVRDLPVKAMKLKNPVYSAAVGLLSLIVSTDVDYKNRKGLSGFFRSLVNA